MSSASYVMSDDDLDQMQERHVQTLANIKELQDMEQQLYSELEGGNKNLSEAEEKQIVSRINELSQMRTGLFNNMKDMYSYLQNNVAESRNDLVNQITTLGIVESELNNAKKNMKALEREKYDQLRMVEINTYFGQQYKAQGQLMRLLAVFCVPILLIGILANSNVIPQSVMSTQNVHNISGGIIFVLLILAVYFIGRKWWDITNRDNMNFNEYNFNFDPASADPSVYDYNMNQLSAAWGKTKSEFSKGEKYLGKMGSKLGGEIGMGCLGEACCARGTKWSKKHNKCMVSSKEAAVANKLTKGAMSEPFTIDSHHSVPQSVLPYSKDEDTFVAV